MTAGEFPERGRDILADVAGEWNLREFDDRDPGAARARRGGNLESDESAADDDDVFRAVEGVTDSYGIVEGPECEDPGRGVEEWVPSAGPGGDDDVIELYGPGIGGEQARIDIEMCCALPNRRSIALSSNQVRA